MFALRTTARLALRAPAVRAPVARLPIRCFAAPPGSVVENEIVIPQLVETLEWVLDSPPPLHQFEEPPIIVEIAGIVPAGER